MEDRYELDELDLPDEAILLDVCAGLVMVVALFGWLTIRFKNIFCESLKLPKLQTTTSPWLAQPFFRSISSPKAPACPTTHSNLDGRHTLYWIMRLLTCPSIFNCVTRLYQQTFSSVLAIPGCVSSHIQAAYTGGYFWLYPKNHLPLHIASSIGHFAVVRLLLEGANF